MKKLLVVTLLAMGSLSACGPVDENPETELAASGPSEETVTAQSLTWHLMGTESCLDMWTTYCSTSVPSGQCYVTAGSPCSSPEFCWKVRNAYIVERYRCF
jgi:hypothetical protein